MKKRSKKIITLLLAAMIMLSGLQTAFALETESAGQEVPAAEYAADGTEWQMEEISLDQEAMDIMRGTAGRKVSTLNLPAQTKKVHYYRTVESFLTGANGKKFSITGDQVWNNTYIKVVVPLKADGSEDLANASAAYCLNAHLASPGENMSNAGLAGLSDKQSIIIGDILALGYKEASGHTISREDWYKWTITQIMIWAVRGGTLQYNTKTGVNELTGQNVSGIDDFKKQLYSLAEYVGGGQYNAWNSYADYLLYNLLNLRKLPQFAYKTETEAKNDENVIRLKLNTDTGLYQMEDEAQGYFIDTTNDKYDKNGVTFYNYTAKKTKNPSAAANVAPELVSDFQYDQHGIDGLQIRWRVEADCYAGPIYGLQFTSDREIPDPVASQKLTREIYGGKSAALVYSDGGGGSTSQYIAAYTPVKETLTAYFAVTTRESRPNPGGFKIRKVSEDGVVAGFEFGVSGSDGSYYHFFTDENGEIDLSGLPVYEEIPVLDDEGNPVIDEETGEELTEQGDLIIYTVQEINVPDRYVIPPPQTFTLASEDGISVTNSMLAVGLKVAQKTVALIKDSVDPMELFDQNLEYLAVDLLKDGRLFIKIQDENGKKLNVCYALEIKNGGQIYHAYTDRYGIAALENFDITAAEATSPEINLAGYFEDGGFISTGEFEGKSEDLTFKYTYDEPYFYPLNE